MIAAVIFDLDGTVIDNEGEWEKAFVNVARTQKLEVSSLPKLTNNWLHEPGMGLINNWRKVLSGDNQKAEGLVNDTVNEYRKLMQNEGVMLPREGMGAVVEKIKDYGWMTGLCTGSSWSLAEPELAALGLYLAFDVTTTGEEVLMQKPDPEIFVLTAQKLGLEPDECLVIEDGISGIRAAAEAGMKCIGLVSDYAPKDKMRAAGATWTVNSLEEVIPIIDGVKKHQKDIE